MVRGMTAVARLLVLALAALAALGGGDGVRANPTEATTVIEAPVVTTQARCKSYCRRDSVSCVRSDCNACRWCNATMQKLARKLARDRFPSGKPPPTPPTPLLVPLPAHLGSAYSASSCFYRPCRRLTCGMLQNSLSCSESDALGCDCHGCCSSPSLFDVAVPSSHGRRPMNAGDLARAKRAAQTTMDRPLCSPAAGTSGHNELRQYEHFVRHLHGHDNRSMLARERNTENTRRPSCLYTIGDLHTDSTVCLSLRIHQKCSTRYSGGASGGASFRVEAMGDTLALCAVVDNFDDTYDVRCPPPEAGRCVNVHVELGFEHFDAFANEVPGGSDVGYLFGNSSNGLRTATLGTLAKRHWCADAATASTTIMAPTPVRTGTEGSGAAAQASCVARASRSDGVWTRPDPQQAWQWVRANNASGGTHCTEQRAATTATHDDASLDASSTTLPSSSGLPAAAKSVDLGLRLGLLTSGLRSVDFIGESHLFYMQECLANDLYTGRVRGVAHSGKGAFRVTQGTQPGGEPPPPEASDGGIATALGARLGANRSDVARWLRCGLPERALGCWPSWNADTSRFNDYPEVGAQSFPRACWRWLPPHGAASTRAAANKNISTSAAAHEPASPTGPPPPRVCVHQGSGMYRAAMTLRLMLADLEAALAAGAPDAAALTSTSVLVVQSGTWDSMSIPSVRLLLDELHALLDALRALHAARATRHARILLVSLMANMPTARTTGVRNSWAHAAVTAYLRRALAAEPGLRVEIVDALQLTWPRELASPDGVHYLRHRFKDKSFQWNTMGLKQRHGLGFLPPEKGAKCIGDAGWEVALALHERILRPT